MLRQAQHERNFSNDFNLTPFAVSLSKGQRRVFQQPSNNHWIFLLPSLARAHFDTLMGRSRLAVLEAIDGRLAYYEPLSREEVSIAQIEKGRPKLLKIVNLVVLVNARETRTK
jgi:hypothetical protein